MRVVLTGGGTGGHFYPLIAVAEALKELAVEEKFLDPELYFLGPSPYDDRMLFEAGIIYVKIPAGKLRRYFSLSNLTDSFKTAWGVVSALITLYRLYPDVVFAKGAYGSFPVLFAARLLSIPVVIHESDVSPGRVNSWAGKFAKKVAVSYGDALDHFPKDTSFLSGQPIRKKIQEVVVEGAREFLKLEERVPIVLILGGSQGSGPINEALLGILPKLLEICQIIHQTGEGNFQDIESTAKVILRGNTLAGRYRPFAYLNELAIRMSYAVASLAVSRAGSSLLELAYAGIPAIVIPIREDVSHDQTRNAFAFGRTGAGIVVEEKNLTPTILYFEIERLLKDEALREKMSAAGKKLNAPDAAKKIAYEIASLALQHEKN